MSDANGPLHPNLARIAAEYDQICTDYASGRLTAQAANRQISALAARDDEGVVWSIDPASGAWVYRTIDGRLEPGQPPAWGYATPTAHNVTRNPTRTNPEHRIMFTQVGDLQSPDELTGSTRKRDEPLIVEKDNKTVKVIAVALAIALVVSVAGWALTSTSGNGNAPGPAPSQSESDRESTPDRA